MGSTISTQSKTNPTLPRDVNDAVNAARRSNSQNSGAAASSLALHGVSPVPAAATPAASVTVFQAGLNIPSRIQVSVEVQGGGPISQEAQLSEHLQAGFSALEN